MERSRKRAARGKAPPGPNPTSRTGASRPASGASPPKAARGAAAEHPEGWSGRASEPRGARPPGPRRLRSAPRLLTKRGEQSPKDRAGVAVADRVTVDSHDGDELTDARRDEHFVEGRDVESRPERQTPPGPRAPGDVEHVRARDARQDPVLERGVEQRRPSTKNTFDVAPSTTRPAPSTISASLRPSIRGRPHREHADEIVPDLRAGDARSRRRVARRGT